MKFLNEADVRAALGRFEGNVAWAAATLGATRGELWEFIQQRPRFVALLADWREEMVDEAESYLRQASLAGKSWAITFIVRSLGKKAGVTQPGSVGGGETPAPGAGPPDFARMNTEQIVRMLQSMAEAQGNPDGTTPPEPEFMQRLDRTDESGGASDVNEAAGAGVRKVLTKYGNVSRAAEKLGVTRAQLMEYLTRRPELQDAANDLREEIVDHAESELRQAVREKKPWAIRFVLKTLGASRGYHDDSRSELPVPSSELKKSRSELPVPSSELSRRVEKTAEKLLPQSPANEKSGEVCVQSQGQEKLGDDLPMPCRSESKISNAALPSRSRPERESSQDLPTPSRGQELRSAERPSLLRDEAKTSDARQDTGEFKTNAIVASNLVEEGRASGRALLESVRAIMAQRLSRVAPGNEAASDGRGADSALRQSDGRQIHPPQGRPPP